MSPYLTINILANTKVVAVMTENIMLKADFHEADQLQAKFSLKCYCNAMMRVENQEFTLPSR